MSEENTIQINFGRPIPLFPLDKPVLLPQQVTPLWIFEPRYRQLVTDALDGAGQIAMATFEGDRWKTEYPGNPPLRPAVCIGQIVQHQKLADGRYQILLQGVCRARIRDEMPPSEDRQYRAAYLEPVGLDNLDEQEMGRIRSSIEDSLLHSPLTRMTASKQIVEFASSEQIPTSALMELVSFTMVTDPAVRYRLLAEGDPGRRWRILSHELDGLTRLLRLADKQRPQDWPKGCSWN